MLMILNLSAYENVFLEQHFCAYKGQYEVSYLEYLVIFCKQTAKGAKTVIIMAVYEYVSL